MFVKVFAVVLLLAAVSAQSQYGQSYYRAQPYHNQEEHYSPAHYEYHYDVQDHHTGDFHGQKEARQGDKTEGQYYLIDADGHRRTVTYHVEGKSGFIAQVQREPVKGYQGAQQASYY